MGRLLLIGLLLLGLGAGQAQYDFRGHLALEGFANNGQNTFWQVRNTVGQVSPQTEALGQFGFRYTTLLDEKISLEIGATGLWASAPDRPADVAPNEFYGSLDFGKFRATLGARARPERYQGLSSVNGDLLWSNNARPLPGVEAGTNEPISIWPWLGVGGGLAHYWLNDDRFVTDPYVHFKYLDLHFRLSPRSTIRAGLHHYAQWGGVSPERGPQPTGFGDFLRVFFDSMGDEDASLPDQQNSLGNHLGSWRLHYRYTLGKGALEAYHQNIFEDSSGMQFGTFPDGVWGLYWAHEEGHWFKGLLYEYVQTTWQSGLRNLFGNDDYFNNGIYRSGWTYFQEVIGIPFFTYNPDLPGVINNSVVAHHLGLRAAFSNLDLRLRTSIVQNRGTRETPFDPIENAVYTHLQLQYPLGEHFGLGLSLGADFSDLNDEAFSAGVSVRYGFGWGSN